LPLVLIRHARPGKVGQRLQADHGGVTIETGHRV
jgi:hypothetical protein